MVYLTDKLISSNCRIHDKYNIINSDVANFLKFIRSFLFVFESSKRLHNNTHERRSESTPTRLRSLTPRLGDCARSGSFDEPSADDISCHDRVEMTNQTSQTFQGIGKMPCIIMSYLRLVNIKKF